MTKVTPEAFLGFARDYYRKIFGQNLRGEARFERDGEGIKHRQAESAYLTKIVEGVKIGDQALRLEKLETADIRFLAQWGVAKSKRHG
ncbi:MAG: hypothetical protein QNL68_11460 [Akkermansiaceae bacterium]